MITIPPRRGNNNNNNNNNVQLIFVKCYAAVEQMCSGSWCLAYASQFSPPLLSGLIYVHSRDSIVLLRNDWYYSFA